MKRALIVCTIALSLGLGAVLQALAQYSDDKPGKLSFRAGVYRPAGGALRDRGGDVWRSFSLDYKLKMDEADRTQSQVSLTRTANKKDRFRGELTSVDYTRYWYVDKDEDMDKGFFYGARAGLYMAKDEVQASIYQPGSKATGTKIGVSVIGGYNFSENWFATVQYSHVGKISNGSDFSGIGLYVGARNLL